MKPKKFYNIPDITFNPAYFDDITVSLSKQETDARYLIKTQPDTATSLEIFTSGIKTNSIEPINDIDTLNISSVSNTATNIINIGNDTTNNQTLNLNSKTINVGNTTVASAVNINTASTFTGNATFNGTLTAATINATTSNTSFLITINDGSTKQSQIIFANKLPRISCFI